MVRDIVIGMADGLTVPFALAAGLSSAVESNKIIVTAGLAEIAAGAIAMGLGGYLAGRTAFEHFHRERAREEQETIDIPEVEAEETAQIFREYGLEPHQVDTVVNAIRKDKNRWIDFMMKFELGIEKPEPKRARNSAITIGLSYMLGGIVPLLPYFLVESPSEALLDSVGVTVLALFIFGYVKGAFTVSKPLRSAFQTLIVGGLAAATAFGVGKLIS
jgi:VIT1/CCC1 family predicted Fe2+/Mn2+ transporter